jgi:hypothetical protein
MADVKKKPPTNIEMYNEFRKLNDMLTSDKGLKKTKKAIAKSLKTGKLHELIKIQTEMFSKVKREDFGNHYNPSDDIFSTTQTGANSDARPAIQDMIALAEMRTGVAFKIANKFPSDATKNWFYFADMNRKEIPMPKIEEWMKKLDLRNQWTEACKGDCKTGAGFLIKYWGNKKDKDGKLIPENMQEPPPKNIPPVAVQALSAQHMSPTNTFESRGRANFVEDMWEFNGGKLNAQFIHKDRVEVIITEPSSYDWRGLGKLEPCWLSLKSYFNCIIFLTKGFGKWGNTVPILKMGDSESNRNAFNNWLGLMQDFVMNGFYLIGKEDELDFVTTNLGAGMTEYIEVLKEDIAAGTSIPVAVLFSRTVTNALGNIGMLPHERIYMNELANYQLSITDNLHRFIGKYWNLEGKQIIWNLAIQKSKEQRLNEDNMEYQNELLELQVKMAKIQYKTQKMQFDIMKENPQLMMMQQQPETTNQNTPDKPSTSGNQQPTSNAEKNKSSIKSPQPESKNIKSDCLDTKKKELRAMHPKWVESTVEKEASKLCRQLNDFIDSINLPKQQITEALKRNKDLFPNKEDKK